MICKLFDYSDETGLLTWKVSPTGSVKVGSAAGSMNRKGGYLRVRVNGKYRMNHEIALELSGVFVGDNQVDHVNGNRTDNRLCNLRVVTVCENMKNKRVGKNNTTGVVGVSVHPSGLYHAHIRVDGRRINLKYTKDKFQAICARMSANNKYGFHKNHGR